VTELMSERTQCVQLDGTSSIVINVPSGVPQGSVLDPLLFTTIHVNNLGQTVPYAKFHFYADNTIIYCCGATLLNLTSIPNIVTNRAVGFMELVSQYKYFGSTFFVGLNKRWLRPCPSPTGL